MNDYRPFVVVLSVTKRLQYVVEARTSEQAEDIAEEYLLDGEEGILLDAPVVEIEEAYASDKADEEDPLGLTRLSFHS